MSDAECRPAIEILERHGYRVLPSGVRLVDANRQSGRTTRMVEEAERLAAEEGDDVLLVFATEAQARNWRKRPGRRVRVRSAGRLFLESAATFKYELALLGNRVFVDHYVIESNFSELLGLLHGFDQGVGLRTSRHAREICPCCMRAR